MEHLGSSQADCYLLLRVFNHSATRVCCDFKPRAADCSPWMGTQQSGTLIGVRRNG